MVFSCCVCNCYYMVDEDRSLLTINRHIRLWTLPISHTTDSLNSFFGLLLWDVTHRSAWMTTGPWQNKCLHNRTAKQQCDTFLHASTLWTITLLLTDSLWQTMGIKRYFWYAKQYLLKILWPFQAWLGVVVVVAALYLQKVHTQETQTFGTKIYKLCGIEWIYRYDMCTCLGKDRTCDYTWCWLSDT